jgi:uncharacterized protein
MKNFIKKYEAPAALIYCAVILTLMEYMFLPPRAEGLLKGRGIGSWQSPSLEAGLLWAGACFVLFMLIPALTIKKVRSDDLKNFGWSLTGFIDHMKTYLLAYLVMVPFILWASTRPEFSRLYPFIPEVRFSIHYLIIWELAYIAQFFALESFFRGYLLFTLNKYTDKWTAIAAMTVPYAMIHFHKPLPECFGAIIAGIILGYLSLKYRSWLGGAVLHSLVAITMDMLSVFG